MLNRIADYFPLSFNKDPMGKQAAPPASTKAPEAANWLEPMAQLVKTHPGAALAAAFAVGVTVAWWIKRR